MVGVLPVNVYGPSIGSPLLLLNFNVGPGEVTKALVELVIEIEVKVVGKHAWNGAITALAEKVTEVAPQLPPVRASKL
jgi:hypothetical protein